MNNLSELSLADLYAVKDDLSRLHESYLRESAKRFSYGKKMLEEEKAEAAEWRRRLNLIQNEIDARIERYLK